MKRHHIVLPRRELLLKGGAGVLGLFVAAGTLAKTGRQAVAAEKVMANLKTLRMGDFNPNYATQWSYRLASAFDDQVIQVQLNEFFSGNTVIKFKVSASRFGNFFRVLIVQSFFVFQIDQRARPDIFSQKKRTAIGAVRRNRAVFSGVLKKAVRRYTVSDRKVAQPAEHCQLLQVVAMSDFYTAVF